MISQVSYLLGFGEAKSQGTRGQLQTLRRFVIKSTSEEMKSAFVMIFNCLPPTPVRAARFPKPPA
jgi:hypothetical protein